MKKNKLFRIVFFAAIVTSGACSKNYITGGTAVNVNAYKNITTYDVLKSNASFDTLVLLIDAAGMENEINAQNTTFFAPSDYSIQQYLQDRTLSDQVTYSADDQFGLDSLLYYLKNNINGTRDSMKMYIINTPLPYSVLTNNGTVYPTALAGDSAAVSYEFVETNDQNMGFNPVVNIQPQVVYFTQLWYPYTISNNTPASAVPSNIGVHNLCKTSGFVTKTGYMDALDNSNPLFFYGTKQ